MMVAARPVWSFFCLSFSGGQPGNILRHIGKFWLSPAQCIFAITRQVDVFVTEVYSSV